MAENKSRPLWKQIGYNILRWYSRTVGLCCFGLRVSGMRNYPMSGGGLVCSNHQSHLDPVLVGLTSARRMNYMARKSLFKFLPLRLLISYLDAIPLEREGLGIAGIKECLKRLKSGEMVLIFPEGTRTPDGRISRFRSGFTVIAYRSKVPLVPVAMEGAFDSWPRKSLLPQMARIAVVVGEPIYFEEYEKLSEADLLIELERRIRDCYAKARQLVGKSPQDSTPPEKPA